MNEYEDKNIKNFEWNCIIKYFCQKALLIVHSKSNSFHQLERQYAKIIPIGNAISVHGWKIYTVKLKHHFQTSQRYG